MLKLDDTNNSSPLAGDFRMYYAGTIVAREFEGDIQVMMVADVVSERNDGIKLKDLTFVGEAWGKSGDLGVPRWCAEEILTYVPPCGYYKVGDGVGYVTYSTDNRTNKKGFQTQRVRFNNRAYRPTLRQCHQLFNRVPVKGCFSRDIYLKDSELFWKGISIGKLHDGNLTINKDYDHIKELVCKVLGRSMAVTLVDNK